jgi:hypothetical protein
MSWMLLCHPRPSLESLALRGGKTDRPIRMTRSRPGRTLSRPRSKKACCATWTRFYVGSNENAHTNSNSGNENLRPETLGVTAQNRHSKSAVQTAETSSLRIVFGNVGLIRTLGNHASSGRLSGGAEGIRTSWLCAQQRSGLDEQ